MKRYVFMPVVLFLFMVFSFTACIDPPYFLPEIASTYTEHVFTGQSLGTVFNVKWKVAGSNLDVVMAAPGTGWVSVGFNDPNITTDKKSNSNIIIGYVINGSEVHIQDNYGTSRSTHEVDAQQNVTVISGAETASPPYTEINFTIPLNSGDPNDIVLTPGMQYYFFIGYAPFDDDFTTIHDDYYVGKITL